MRAAQACPLVSFFTIHSCGLWREVFGDRKMLGSNVSEGWGERAVSLLRCLPLNCQDRHLIVAVLTLPLGEADATAPKSSLSVHSKKAKLDTAVAACLRDLLKWPVKERDSAQAIHQGDVASCCTHAPLLIRNITHSRRLRTRHSVSGQPKHCRIVAV
jgi:hypothetical protein